MAFPARSEPGPHTHLLAPLLLLLSRRVEYPLGLGIPLPLPPPTLISRFATLATLGIATLATLPTFEPTLLVSLATTFELVRGTSSLRIP